MIARDPLNGWEEADRLDAAYEAERHEVLSAVEILDLSEALDVQVHDDGLTCPNPDHPQSGDSAPASTFLGDEGIERWHCHACGEGGTAIDFVLLAGHAEGYGEALELLRDVASAPSTSQRHRATSRHQAPPEDRRRRCPVTGRSVQECEPWAIWRGWEPDVISSLLGPDRWSFVYAFETGEHFLRLYTDDEQVSWQDRPIPDGHWRSASGRPQRLFIWEPPAGERLRSKIAAKRAGAVWNPPRPLVVEGAADFLTAVVAQVHLGRFERFAVLGLPGAGRTSLLTQRDDWCVITDNDEAGIDARDRIDAEQSSPVHHLFVPAPHGDLNEWWRATRPRERRRWISDLVTRKDARGGHQRPSRGVSDLSEEPTP